MEHSDKVDHATEAVKLLTPCNPLGDPDNGLATGACAHALLAIVEELRGLRADLSRLTMYADKDHSNLQVEIRR